MGKPVQQGLFLSSLGDFRDGMNSDVPPVSLPPTQLSFAENCTMRGNFVTYRSPYIDFVLNFPNTTVQTAFESGTFQGSCFYKPDTGAEKLIVSISGKFYAVTPAGTNAQVVDISAPDDNSVFSFQSWMWQCENFVIINDGVSAPAIYNGVSTVRASQGELVATISSTWTVPAEGASVSVTFSADFSGPFNVPLYAYDGTTLLGTFEVNVNSASSGYQIRLTNIDDPPGTTHDTLSEIWIRNNWMGTAVTNGDAAMANPLYEHRDAFLTCNVQVTPPFTAQLGSVIQWTTINRNASGFSALETIVVQINSNGNTLLVKRGGGGVGEVASVSIAAGAPGWTPLNPPDVLVAKITQDLGGALAGIAFIAPNLGAFVDVTVDRLVNYNGQIVEIDGAHYSVSVVPPVTGTTFYLKTISVNNSGGPVNAGAQLKTIPQIPPGRMGAYGLGRNWICKVDGQSYLGSDIVGSSSGSIAYAFRDSILNVSENSYLAGGGVFRVPSAGQQIAAMRFPATLDSSLGQGPLQVLTQDTTFSCNAPIQRLEWQTLTNPIQTQSLVGGGALSHYSCVAVNGDLWFRSDDGIRSLKLARQDFQTYYSNTPQSVEMSRVLLEDNRNLLQYSSAIVFDNRMLMTASPAQGQRGIYHDQLVVLNLDPTSSLRVKEPSIYDGVWQDLKVLQLVTGTFAGLKRAFAFVVTDANKIGLIEILPTAVNNTLDNRTERIQWRFESPAVFYQPDARSRELLKLADGEIFVKDLVGTVRFKVEFRPDWLQTWTTWHEWDVSDTPDFQPRMGLGTPPITGDDNTGRPNCVGYFFQLRVTVTGPCTFMGCNLFATAQPVTSMAPPMPGLGYGLV